MRNTLKPWMLLWTVSAALASVAPAAVGRPKAEVKVVTASVLLGPAISPDGRRLAFVDASGELIVADVDALWRKPAGAMKKLGKIAETIRRTRGAWVGGGLHWRPDSKRVAAWQMGEDVRVFDPSGRSPLTKVRGQPLPLPPGRRGRRPEIALGDGEPVPADYYKVPWINEAYYVGANGLQRWAKAAGGAPNLIVANAALAGKFGVGWRVGELVRSTAGRHWVLVRKQPPGRPAPGPGPGPVPVHIGRAPPNVEHKLIVAKGKTITEVVGWTRRAIGLFGYEPAVQVAVADDGRAASVLFVDYGLANTPVPPAVPAGKTPEVWVVRVGADGKPTKVDLDSAPLGRDKWQTPVAPTVMRIPGHRLVGASPDARRMLVWATDERRATKKYADDQAALRAPRPTDAISNSIRRDGTAVYGFQISRLVRVDVAARSILDASARLSHGLKVPASAVDTGGLLRYADGHGDSGLLVFRVRKHSQQRNRPATGFALVRLPRKKPAGAK